ncbi:putative Ig domain-containing protein [Sphingomonas sp. Leaf62]|uniref:putative Ig domain-containing protein n=1 Tax=Sphingomonas sp. Leaf62 TaxID=1736228 RepID=UPI0007000484|nr:putative Ig domain-containing protein [Sphingomonas sp. Leaf62]KQN77887.1 hypothetical protein ASE91_14315 [Sphingomonas sp. Leaf62]
MDNILNPNVPGLDVSLPEGQRVTVRTSQFAYDLMPGTLIAKLVDPFGGGSTFEVAGTVPGQLVLSGDRILRGTGAAMSGTSYSIVIIATSPDGVKQQPVRLTFRAVLPLGGMPAALAPSLAFVVTVVSIVEGNSGTQSVSNTLNVVRNGLTGPLTVNLAYSGTASAGLDYSAPTSVTIPANASSVTFDISVVGDTTVEVDETIVIDAALAGLPLSARKTITLINDDASGTPETIAGMAIGAIANDGPMAGMILTTGDDFNGPLLIIGPAAKDRFNPYTSTRGDYLIPAAGQGPRSSEGLGGYDADPNFTGYNNSNRGKPVASMADMITQTGGKLRLKQRDMVGDEALHVSRNNKSVLSSMLTTALRTLLRAPGVFEWEEQRFANARDHMTGWIMQRISFTVNDIEGDVEAGSHPDGAGDGREIEFNNNVWFNGTRSTTRSKGSPTAIAPDWSVPHKFAIKMTEAGWLEYYWNGVLQFTFDTEGTAVLRNAYHMIWTAHMYNVTRPAGESLYVISWWRAFAKNGHFKALAAPVLIQVAAGASFNVALPSTTALWGRAVNEDMQALMCEANEPGGSINGELYDDAPPGITLNKTTPSVSGSTSTPGRVQFGRYADEPGYSSDVHRFVLEVGPKINVSNFSVTQGVAVDIDIYKLIDFGILVTDGTNPSTTITFSALPTGLVFSNTTGKLTGTTSDAVGNRTIRITATNSVGQSEFKDFVLAVVAKPVDQTYAYQSLASLIADFDASRDAMFANATGDVPTWGNPVMVAGANAGDPARGAGNLAKAATVSLVPQRKSSQLGGRSVVGFTRGSSGVASTVLESDQNVPVSSVLQGTDPEFTLVFLFKPTAAFTGVIGGWSEQIGTAVARVVGLVRRSGSASSFRFGTTSQSTADLSLGTLNENVWYLVMLRHKAGKSDAWVNGVKVIDNADHTSPTVWTSAARMNLGNAQGGTSTEGRYPTTAFHGDIAQFLAFNAAITDEQGAQIRTDLTNKWSLA